MEQHESDMLDSFRDAVEQVQGRYGIMPAVRSGPVQNGPMGCARDLYLDFLRVDAESQPGQRLLADWINARARQLTANQVRQAPPPDPFPEPRERRGGRSREKCFYSSELRRWVCPVD